MKSNVQKLSSFFTIHLMYKGMIVLPVNAISLMCILLIVR